MSRAVTRGHEGKRGKGKSGEESVEAYCMGMACVGLWLVYVWTWGVEKSGLWAASDRMRGFYIQVASYSYIESIIRYEMW